MQRFLVHAAAGVFAVALASGCDRPSSPTDPITLTLNPSAAASAAVDKNSGAHLTGADEVPARDTRAQGQAIFQLSKDGNSVDFRLIATNIDNVVQAHIHLAPAGVNGQIVVFLYGLVAGGGGRQTGVLSTGTFTAADLIGPLAGQPLSDLIDAMRSGGAYVNVHTNDGDSTPNTGAGDFPGGEIRGQISVHGPTL